MYDKTVRIELAGMSEVCYRTAYHLIMLDYNRRKGDYYFSSYDAMLDLAEDLRAFPSISGSIKAYAFYNFSGQTIKETLAYVLCETRKRKGKK